MINEKTKSMSTNIDQLENTSDPIITLKAVFKIGKHTVQPAFNRTINWYQGVKRLSEDEKKKESYYVEPSSKLVLQDGLEFDLRSEVDSKNWEWVKHLKEVAMSFEEAQSSPQAMFYVSIPGREARDANKMDDLRFQAMKFIMEDSPSNFEDRALILGSDLLGESPESIKKFLLDIAKEKPHLIISSYTAKNLSINLLYLHAKRNRIIEERDHVIMFGSNVLGVNDEGAIIFLQMKENEHILDLLSKEAENLKTLKAENEENKKSDRTYNFNKKK